MMRIVSVVFTVVALVGQLSVARAADPEGLPEGVQSAEVAGQLDGDKITVEVDGETRELNFVGADAPEPGECYVKESNAAIEKLLPEGTPLWLETDAKATDNKDRLLRHVWASDKHGKAYLVNAKLIRDGIAGWKAKDAEDGNAKYADRYEKAQADAKEKKNGLWDECDRLHSKARTKSEQTRAAGRERARATEEPAPDEAPAEAVAPAPYEIASEERVEAPNGRTRYRYEVVIPGQPGTEAVTAALVEVVRTGFATHGDAVVVIVFAFRDYSQTGGAFPYTAGRAAASRDGKGLDEGSDALLAGEDDGRIQVDVVTGYSADFQIATDEELIYVELDL